MLLADLLAVAEEILAARVVESVMAMVLAMVLVVREIMAIMVIMALIMLAVILLLILMIIARYVASLLGAMDQKTIRNVFVKPLVEEELVMAKVLEHQQVLNKME